MTDTHPPSREQVEALMAQVLGGNVWDAEVWQAANRVMVLFGYCQVCHDPNCSHACEQQETRAAAGL